MYIDIMLNIDPDPEQLSSKSYKEAKVEDLTDGEA